MYISVIFSAIFFLILALEIHKGAKRARKRGWQYAITRFTVVLLSALISIFVARAVAAASSSALLSALAENTLPQQIKDIFNDLPSAPGVISALISMIVAPIIFYPINSVIKLILRLLTNPALWLAGLAVSAIRRALDKSAAKKAEGQAAAEATPSEQERDGDKSTAEFTADGEAAENSDVPDEDVPAEAISEPESVPETEAPKKKKRRIRTPEERERTMGGVGIVFGILTGVLSFFVAFAPIMAGLGIIGMVEDTVSAAGVAELEGAAPIVEVVHECTHNAAVSTMNAAGGKLMLGALTSFSVGDEKISLYNETELILGVARTVLEISGEEKSADEKAAALDGILPLFDRSAIIPVIASEFLSGASSAWERGETFCGIAMPVSADSPAHGVVLEAAALFRDSNADTVREDVGTVVKLAAVIVRNDVVGNMPENPLELLENRALVSDLFFEIFENTRLKSLIGSLVNTGIDLMTDSLGVPKTLDGAYASLLSELQGISVETEEALEITLRAALRRHGIDITDESLAALCSSVRGSFGLSLTAASQEQISALLSDLGINKDGETVAADLSTDEGFRTHTLLVTTEHVESANGAASTDSRAEANALAEVFASVSDLTDIFSGTESDVASTVKSFGGILDKLAACGTVGKRCIDSLIVALLQSDAVYDTIHMDKVSATHFAGSMIGGSEGGSYSAMMNEIADVIAVMTKSSSGTGLNKGDMKAVIASLSPDTAEAMGHLISEGLVSNMGFGESTSTGVSDILSRVFGNIADAKSNGMDDATYEMESENIAHLVDVTMSISTSPEKEIDVDSYVDSVLASKIVTDSLCETVYSDGEEPRIDPLGTGMKLSESNKTSLVTKLQSSIDAAADGESREAAKREAVAIAAYLGVGVELVGDTVTLQDSTDR